MSINESLVLVILSQDRPGLVNSVSSLVTLHGGNWLESHLSSVAGYFGGMIHLSVPSDSLEELVSSLRELETLGVRVLMDSSPEAVEPSPEQAVHIEIVGNDRPGIITRISEAIATRGINLEKLESETTSAPMSGNEIFTARAELGLPEGVSISELKADLEEIAADLMIDISVE